MPYLTDLEKSLQKLSSSECSYLLISPDRVRLERLQQRLLEHLKVETESSAVYFGETLDQRSMEQILNELASFNLFSKRRLIKLLQADEMKSAALDLLVQHPLSGENPNLLLVCASGLKSNSRLRKVYRERKALLELLFIPEKEIKAWTIAHADALGIQLSGKVAGLISEIFEGSPDRIDQALQHLKIYCDEGAKPQEVDVLALFQHAPDPNEFQLLEQILEGKAVEAKVAVQELLDNGKNPFLLLNLLGKSISRLLLLQVELERGTRRPELAKSLGMPPWLVEKQLRILKRNRKRELLALQESIIAGDARLKGKSLEPKDIFHSIIHCI